MTGSRRAHWDAVYRAKAPNEVSRYEPVPERSLALIRDTDIAASDAIIDVRGGASRLVEELLRAGYQDLTVLDISAAVLEALRAGLLPQGHLILATFGSSGPQRCSGLPVVRYDAVALAAELGGGFRLLDSFLTAHRTPWNAEQEFLYARFSRA